MPAYYMLECYGKTPGTRAQVSIESDVKGGWKRGKRITATVPDPVECEVVTKGEMVSMFKGAGLLMIDTLVEALRAAGVDNLDVYTAIIRHPNTGETWTNYKAVNIIGIVSCADMAQSNTPAATGELIDVPFDGLVIDEQRTGGALMFRLAEAIGGIVIHEKVKQRLEDTGFDDLSFEDPKDWIG
jgi:hypothetical protein